MSAKRSGYLTALALTLITSSISSYIVSQKSYSDSNSKNKTLILIDQLNNRFNDYFYEDKKIDINSSNAVLVGIDGPSVTEIGRWPWSRKVITQLSKTVLESGSKSLSYDIIFSEPESKAADQMFGQFIKNNSNQIILGTTSEQPIQVAPYQDYCMNEAFLFNGGDSLVKINASLVVDDSTTRFEELNFATILTTIFKNLNATTTSDFINSKGVKSYSSLSTYQKNTLNFEKKIDLFRYCTTWLSADDVALAHNFVSLKAAYQEIFNTLPEFNNLDFEAQLNKFKHETLNNPLNQFGFWQPNIDELQRHALYTSSFNALQDSDGLIRRYPLVYRTGNRLGTSYIPSMALQAYLTQTGYEAFLKLDIKDGLKYLSKIEIKDVSGPEEKTLFELPTNERGELLINYYGKANTLPVISAKDLLVPTTEIPVYTKNGIHTVNRVEFLKDRAVIVGATALGINDIRNTPLDILFLGPEIHLTVINNIFQQNFIRYLPKESSIIFIFLFFFGIILGYFLVRFEIVTSFVIYILANAAIYLALLQLRRSSYVVQGSLLIFVSLFVLFFGIIIYKYFFEARKSKAIRKTFSKYVSKEIVEEILKNEQNLELKGQKLNMTVYFSDIRGFTQFSEKMDPQELSQLLNRYLTPMTHTIFNHKGTIDKFMGDGVMAMFGAPINYKNHAEQACAASLACIENLEKINEEFAKKSWPEINIGIGLNTGFMNVGNIGSDTIQSYTVIGDAVNLASRVESLTKNYGAKILITESTYDAVKDKFIAREVDRVRVKGKMDPVKIFELLSSKAFTEENENLEKFSLAYQAYHQRQFREALKAFTYYRQIKPNDMVCELYINRCIAYMQESPPEDWDGVYDYKTK